jgi:hypothetical protein
MKVVDADGQIVAMVGYDCFSESACHAHMAALTPIAWRHLLPNCIRYPFESLGLTLVIGTVLSTNAKSLAATRALGLQEKHRIRDAHAVGVDIVLFEGRRENATRHLTPPKEKEDKNGWKQQLPHLHADGPDGERWKLQPDGRGEAGEGQ